MELIADGLLIAGALAAAFYCWVLSVRVKGLKDLDQGLGAAIAGLSNQVNDMRVALKNTQASAGASADTLRQTTDAAEAAADRLADLLENFAEIEPTRAKQPKPAPRSEPKVETRERPAPVQRQEKPAPKTAPQVVAEPRLGPQEMPNDTANNTANNTAGTVSAAQKLQEDIRERVTGRSNSGAGQEDFVKALQSVLAAANK